MTRSMTSGPRRPARPVFDDVPPSGITWRLPGDLGRQYAAVSGDRNPIHLYADHRQGARLQAPDRPRHVVGRAVRGGAREPAARGGHRRRGVQEADLPAGHRRLRLAASRRSDERQRLRVLADGSEVRGAAPPGANHTAPETSYGGAHGSRTMGRRCRAGLGPRTAPQGRRQHPEGLPHRRLRRPRQRRRGRRRPRPRARRPGAARGGRGRGGPGGGQAHGAALPHRRAARRPAAGHRRGRERGDDHRPGGLLPGPAPARAGPADLSLDGSQRRAGRPLPRADRAAHHDVRGQRPGGGGPLRGHLRRRRHHPRDRRPARRPDGQADAHRVGAHPDAVRGRAGALPGPRRRGEPGLLRLVQPVEPARVPDRVPGPPGLPARPGAAARPARQPARGREQKSVRLHEILDLHPGLRFVLIGDSGRARPADLRRPRAQLPRAASSRSTSARSGSTPATVAWRRCRRGGRTTRCRSCSRPTATPYAGTRRGWVCSRSRVSAGRCRRPG